MTCDHCNGPGSGSDQCCWARAMEIKKFRKRVLHKYILEVIFEMTISISSVLTDIITLVMYLQRSKWWFAAMTALPVLLPTTVFTNVYLADEQKGYFNVPGGSADSSKLNVSRETDLDKEKESEETVEPGSEETPRCQKSRNCCSGFRNLLFDKDRSFRERAVEVVRRSARRSVKYFFGAFILRFIAWTWYLKALVFGFKALKYPKRLMKMEPPDSHWSYELLVRLDFLQAALENAPQCVIQLYALLTDAEEDRALSILTLLFSFLDFVRVTTTVLWNIAKGPVVAKPGCYGSLLWKVVNISSWVFLYFGRCCALALAVAASSTLGVLITALAVLLHMGLFGKILSLKRIGVAGEKILVTAFISVFFLPELDSTEVDILIQFYYATVLLENTFFIVPWNGLEYNYCGVWTTNASNKSSEGFAAPQMALSASMSTATLLPSLSTSSSSSETPKGCLFDPAIAVISVPALTVLGMILRLAAAKKMAKFKAANPDSDKPTTMEEKVANIYSRKWATLTISELASAFGRMLRKEVAPKNPHRFKKRAASTANDDTALPTISEQFAREIHASHTFIRKSFSLILGTQIADTHLDENSLKPSPPQRNKSASLSTATIELPVPAREMERRLTFPRSRTGPLLKLESLSLDEINSTAPAITSPATETDGDENVSQTSVPKSFFTPAALQNSTAITETLFSSSIGIKYLDVPSERPEEMTNLQMDWP